VDCDELGHPADILEADYADHRRSRRHPDFTTRAELDAYIANLESDMREAAKKFELEIKPSSSATSSKNSSPMKVLFL